MEPTNLIIVDDSDARLGRKRVLGNDNSYVYFIGALEEDGNLILPRVSALLTSKQLVDVPRFHRIRDELRDVINNGVPPVTTRVLGLSGRLPYLFLPNVEPDLILRHFQTYSSLLFSGSDPSAIQKMLTFYINLMGWYSPQLKTEITSWGLTRGADFFGSEQLQDLSGIQEVPGLIDESLIYQQFL